MIVMENHSNHATSCSMACSVDVIAALEQDVLFVLSVGFLAMTLGSNMLMPGHYV